MCSAQYEESVRAMMVLYLGEISNHVFSIRRSNQNYNNIYLTIYLPIYSSKLPVVQVFTRQLVTKVQQDFYGSTFRLPCTNQYTPQQIGFGSGIQYTPWYIGFGTGMPYTPWQIRSGIYCIHPCLQDSDPVYSIHRGIQDSEPVYHIHPGRSDPEYTVYTLVDRIRIRYTVNTLVDWIRIQYTILFLYSIHPGRQDPVYHTFIIHYRIQGIGCLKIKHFLDIDDPTYILVHFGVLSLKIYYFFYIGYRSCYVFENLLNKPNEVA